MSTVGGGLPPITDVSPPVKLTIAGDFWDSQIYSGKLFLFTCDRRVLQLNWRSFISQLPVAPELKVAAEIAFLGNRALYDHGAQMLLRDPDVRKLLLAKFTKLSVLNHDWEEEELEWLSEIDNELPFPHNDSDIHYSTLYTGSSEGIHSREINGNSLLERSDVPALALAAKFHTVAWAAGDEGLYELDDGRISETRISELPCVRCEWSYASIVAAGPNNRIYVAEFDRSRNRQTGSDRSGIVRRLERVITEDELFGQASQGTGGVTWGARNRLFRFTGNQIQVLSCTSGPETRTAKKGLRFQGEGSIQAAARMTQDAVVSARVAPFGSVVELNDGLLVIPTKGEVLFLPGEPTNWRVFPRAKDYVNQLHVVYEDHLDIIAFTHDYFVSDQSSKIAGFSMGDGDTEDN